MSKLLPIYLLSIMLISGCSGTAKFTDGTHETKYNDGRTSGEYEYKDGKLNGYVKHFYYADQNSSVQYGDATFKTNAVDGKFNSPAIFEWKRASVVAPQKEKGKISSKDQNYNENFVMDFQYKDGLINGPLTIKQDEKEIYYADFKDGKLDGTVRGVTKEYMPTMELLLGLKPAKSRINFIEPLDKSYADKFFTFQGNTANDQLNGSGTVYYPNKKIYKASEHKDGKLISLKIYYENGKLSSETNLDSFVAYYPDGTKKAEAKCANYNMKNDFKVWDKAGKLIFDGANDTTEIKPIQKSIVSKGPKGTFIADFTGNTFGRNIGDTFINFNRVCKMETFGINSFYTYQRFYDYKKRNMNEDSSPIKCTKYEVFQYDGGKTGTRSVPC